ncbi:Crp/Fnr family transcriptional regulator [Ruminococcaceae bacterium OttesenSCG-928-A11]|nr:Crp/Fnr family transcriptional regulator [Ruminococcaceae bacterium OttesenSCG-928-A11]
MTFEELLEISPGLAEVTRNMPASIRQNFTLKRYAPKCIIHQKDTHLTSFGIVCQGQHRVINEFANGNVFMIEKNNAISFIGEVTLLAGHTHSSVTIETITECLVMFISLEDFEDWIGRDIHFLRLVSRSIAQKLYSASYKRGERQYYSVRYVVLQYLMDQARPALEGGKAQMTLKQTRQQMSEELGLTTKTLNRTITDLQKSGLIDSAKGKVVVSGAQLENMALAAGQYARQSKRGARHLLE